MKSKRKTTKEFSKKMALAILVVALVDIQFSFLLAFLGREEIAQDLAITICSTIVGVYIPYCLKAYFGKKAEVETSMQEKEVICLEPEEEGWEDLKL